MTEDTGTPQDAQPSTQQGAAAGDVAQSENLPGDEPTAEVEPPAEAPEQSEPETAPIEDPQSEEVAEPLSEPQVQPASVSGSQPAPEPDLALDVGTAAPPDDPVSTAPFVVYAVAWLLFAGAVVWQLASVPAGQAVYEADVYPLTAFIGVTLACAGPLVIIAAWLSARRSPQGPVRGAFSSALSKGAWAMLFGVSMWWAALMIVDYVRMGRVL